MTIHPAEPRGERTPPARTGPVMIIGGIGVFGRRLADHLAADGNLPLILTSRSRQKAAEMARRLKAKHAGSEVSGVALDTASAPERVLEDMRPFLVVDASGPFQGTGYAFPRAALNAGAHCIDLADARVYLAGYGDGLDRLATDKGLVARAGASSTPALSLAVVRALAQDWQRIDTVDLCITPGGRSDVGRAVIEAVLSYAGRPVPVWKNGHLTRCAGWSNARKVTVPGLGSRRAALVETHDAELIGGRFQVADRVTFCAGLEHPLEQIGMECLGWLVQKGVPLRPSTLAPLLHRMRRITRYGMSDRGGMVVDVAGRDARNRPRRARWSLLARHGDGPAVPVLAAAALARKIVNGAVEPGAGLACDVLSLAEIEAEMTRYAIATAIST